MRSHLKFIGLVIVMGLIGYGLFSIGHRVDTLATQLQESKADRTALRAELEQQEGAAAKHLTQMEALAAQVERLGGKPVVDPANPTAPPVALGPTNAQVLTAIKVICAGEQSLCSPTQAQVKTALTAICGGDCRGEDAAPPRDGQDGNNATDAQIDAAVARNCGEDGCRGPGPTDQQVDERIAAHCADGRCRGEKGDSIKGEPGTVTPGDYTCPDGEWMTAIHVAEGGAMTVDCSPLIGRGD